MIPLNRNTEIPYNHIHFIFIKLLPMECFLYAHGALHSEGFGVAFARVALVWRRFLLPVLLLLCFGSAVAMLMTLLIGPAALHLLGPALHGD